MKRKERKRLKEAMENLLNAASTGFAYMKHGDTVFKFENIQEHRHGRYMLYGYTLEGAHYITLTSYKDLMAIQPLSREYVENMMAARKQKAVQESEKYEPGTIWKYGYPYHTNSARFKLLRKICYSDVNYEVSYYEREHGIVEYVFQKCDGPHSYKSDEIVYMDENQVKDLVPAEMSWDDVIMISGDPNFFEAQD